MGKKRILLNWDGSRKDLMEPFVAMMADIDFILLWGDEDYRDRYPCQQIFYSSYKTPYQLLRDVKPDKIIFFNINSFPQVAVSLAAMNTGIPRYTMHHGIHHADNLEINLEKERQGMHTNRKPVSSFATLYFYFSALRSRNLDQVWPFIRFAWMRQRRDRLIAAAKVVFKGRLPDRYINLSPHNALIAMKIDSISNDRKFIYIGHPFFDDILDSLNRLKTSEKISDEKYFLLIDFPNKEDVLDFRLMTGEGKRDFYKRLSGIARQMGYRLKIKLHPFGYESPYNYEDDNTDLVRDTNIAELIHNADKCFSFFSTLLIPIIFHKGYCYLFSIGKDRNLQKELVELGLAIKLDTKTFESETIVESVKQVHPGSYKTFVERYLYYTDGKATERLKSILTSDEPV